MNSNIDVEAATTLIAATITALPEPERDVLLHHDLHPDPPPLSRLARQRGMQRIQLNNLETRARKHLACICDAPVVRDLVAAAAQLITDVVPLHRVLDRIPALQAEAAGIPLWQVLVRHRPHCAPRRTRCRAAMGGRPPPGPIPLRHLILTLMSKTAATESGIYRAAAKPPFTIVDGHVTWLQPAADRGKALR